MDTNDISRLWIGYEGKGLSGLFEFAKIIAQKAAEEERESCAKVCDDLHHTWRFGDGDDSASGPKECASMIRERSNV